MVGETWKAHAALVFVAFTTGVYHVITKVALTGGVNQLVFCALRDILALTVLLPVAYFKERRTRPPLSRQLLLSFLLLGLTGIFANQLLFIIGLKLTSPIVASAMQPTMPVLTFIFALLMGAEVVRWKERSGKVKVAGALLCLSGAMFMILYKGPAIWGGGIDSQMRIAMIGKPSPEPIGWLATALLNLGFDTWHIGTLCLVGNCTFMAFYISYQAPLLARYPAGVSLTTWSYLFGTAFIALAGFFGANSLSDWILTVPEILAVLYAGLVQSALNYNLLTWSNKVLGPVLVALYVPLQPMFSSFLSCILLGSSIYMGSVLGGALIISGLYLVTWGQKESRKLGVHGVDSHTRVLNIGQDHDEDTSSIALLDFHQHIGQMKPSGFSFLTSRLKTEKF